MTKTYITTPIYYVNDRPHIGHCYTTLVADVAARFHRLLGHDVFFLTGTDEHAEKVVRAAADHDMTPQAWADRNAAEYVRAFADMGFSHDDFIRTSEERHKTRATAFIRQLVETGDIYLGDYEGWYDPSQEEYLTETVARDAEYLSPVTGRPLERRKEKNYFFRLSAYEQRLAQHIDAHAMFVLPESRRNEVLGRFKQGLSDVPISRAVKEEDPDWGIVMPDDPTHRIYVWIEALLNYITAIDTDDRRDYWPATMHTMAKDIIWFHAVIWPAMLMALKRPLPKTIYAHAFWVSEGRKMSKSLGNFIEIDLLRAYSRDYSVDALRWYLATQGPLGSTDSDFAHLRFVEVYNSDLANGIGNCTSRVGNMIAKYFDGVLPDPKDSKTEGSINWQTIIEHASSVCHSHIQVGNFDSALQVGRALISDVDGYINETAPFRLAKKLDEDPANQDRLAAILYHCAEVIRIASIILSPAMPHKMAALHERWGCTPPANTTLNALLEFCGRHRLMPGTRIEKGDALFMRAEPDVEPPAVDG